MNFWESLLEAFSGSSRNTNSIEQTRMLNIIKQIALETDSIDKKTDTNGKQDINEEEEEPTGFISDAADKVGSVFSRCKSPYFTTIKKYRGGPKKYDGKLEGETDPFYDYLDELYPGKGLQGLREENLDKFKKISKGTVSLASQRYVKVEKVLKKVKNIAAFTSAVLILFMMENYFTFNEMTFNHLDSIIIVIVMLLYSIVFLKGKLYLRIIMPLIAFGLNMIISFVTLFLMGSITGKTMEESVAFSTAFRYIYLVVVQTTYIFILWLILRIRKKNITINNRYDIFAFIVIPVLCMIGMYTDVFIYQIANFDSHILVLIIRLS